MRAGFALIEVLVAAVLSAIVIAVAGLVLHAQNRIARDITSRSERNDAVRTAFATLRAELRHLTIADLRAHGSDSLTARIFRGSAVVCGFDAQDTFVRYRGLRLPDPAKDSALELGSESVITVYSARPDSTACLRFPGEQVLALRWPAPPRIGAAWLIFESGGYHLSTYALRYRRTGESRQPITNEVFDHTRSTFTARADSVVWQIEVALHDRGLPFRTHTRLPLLNSR